MKSWRTGATQAIERLCYIVAGMALIVMLVASVVDVAGRKTIGFSLNGVIDIVTFSVVIATMMGIALAWSRGGHIVVDLLDMTGSPIILRFLDIFNRVAGIVLMPLLAWLAYREMRDVFAFGDTSSDLGIPMWWYWVFVLLGYLLSALLLLIAPPRYSGGPNV
jgi:TRAP-type C4-dicarboxylate transport system permease small subunit